MQAPPPVTICLLTYGAYPRLARRTIESIHKYCPRALYELVVGANQVCWETLHYLRELRDRGQIDRLVVSKINRNKCPMMRRMFARVRTEFIWWFDDDSYITELNILPRYLEICRKSEASVAMWGQMASCDFPHQFTDLPNVTQFIRRASWYGGLTPPSWEPGGKGEFNFEGRGTGDGRWWFMVGGCWFIRSACIRALDWPDPRIVKNGDDVLLGEAIRQQGWSLQNVGTLGVAINTEPRRGDPGKTAPILSRHLKITTPKGAASRGRKKRKTSA